MIKSVINFWIVLLFGGVAFGQCPTPSQVMKADRKNGWAENSQSKSGAVLTGEVYEYSFIVQRGLDYRISALGGTSDLKKENVEFKIYDTQVQRVEVDGQIVHKRFETVVFDSKNAVDGEDLIFNSPRTRKLTLRLEVVNSDNPKEAQCVVVFVEAKKAQQIGLR